MGLNINDFLGSRPEVNSSTLDRLSAEGTREGVGTETGAGAKPVSGPPWTLPIEHLSASSLNMLAICPRQFQQRYILGIKEPPTQAQVVGNSFHTTIEYNYRQKQVSHEDLPAKDVIEYYHDQAWPGALAEAGGEHEIKWWDQKEARSTGDIMVQSYHREKCPMVQPVEVEYQFSVLVPDTPVPVVGRIDAMDAESIIDLKTSKRKVSKMKPGWRNQAKIYQLASPRHATFHVVTNKGENIDGDFTIPYSNLTWLETERWVSSLAGLAQYYYATYGDGDGWPTTGSAHDWRCDWCGYRKDCPAWRV